MSTPDDATYRPDDWPPEPKPYRTVTPGSNVTVVDPGPTAGHVEITTASEPSRLSVLETEIAALKRQLADHGEALTLLAENDDDIAANAVRNERLRTTIRDRADEAKSYAEAPDDGAERDRA